jgi:hypothetical protein
MLLQLTSTKKFKENASCVIQFSHKKLGPFFLHAAIQKKFALVKFHIKET